MGKRGSRVKDLGSRMVLLAYSWILIKNFVCGECVSMTGPLHLVKMVGELPACQGQRIGRRARKIMPVLEVPLRHLRFADFALGFGADRAKQFGVSKARYFIPLTIKRR